LSLIAIYKSQSRQGFLVLFFGLTFYISIYFMFILKKYAIPVTLGAVIASTLTTLGMLQIGPLTQLLYKESVSIRGYYWRAAFEMFKNQPLTGVGVDSYISYFKQFREIEYPLRYGFELSSSNAHNVPLQFFATSGIFVGTSYLFIVLLVFVSSIKLLRKQNGNNQKIIAILLSAWVGHIAQSLISIDNISLAIWGWTLSGVLLGLVCSNTYERDNAYSESKSKTTQINLKQPMISILVLAPILLISIFIYRAETDTFWTRTYASQQNENSKNLLLKYAGNIFTNPLADSYYKFQVALRLSDAGFLPEAHKQISSLSEQDPRDTSYLGWLASYEYEVKQNLTGAAKLRQQIALFDPWNLDNQLKLGILLKENGSTNKAKDIKDMIILLAPGSRIATEALRVLP
jgi:hypothetical protein